MSLPLVLSIALSACSFAMVRVPHSVKPAAPGGEMPELPSCEFASPSIDAVAGGLALTFAVLIATDTQGNRNSVGALFAVPYAVIGLIYGGSALYGFRAKSRCRRLEREVEELASAEAEREQFEKAAPLLNEATESARRGDCVRVRVLAKQARAFVLRAFERDAAIAGCLKNQPDESQPVESPPVESPPAEPPPAEPPPAGPSPAAPPAPPRATPRATPPPTAPPQ